MIALGVLACAFPSWAQEKAQATSSSGDSYSEHLKELSSGQEGSKSASNGKSSEVYKDHLRQLAGGDTTASAPVQAQSEQSSENSGAPDGERNQQKRAEEVTVSNSARTSQAPAEAGANSPKIERVSAIPTKKEDESIQPAAMSPQAAPAGNCSDAYCEQLRRVAEGQTQERYVSHTDDGRTLTTERNFVKNLAFDQIHIWESPFKMRDSDATWAVPFGIFTGSLVATDHDASKQLAKPTRLDTSKKISNLGLYSFIGAGAGFYGLGLISHDDHKRETGLLSGEAFINATLLAEALKYAFGRQRPFEADHFGHIGKGGSSFPSGHAIDSWAVATVFAHEYPNPFMEIAAYGLASAVSVSRITAGQHFPSDVLVGSTFGYLIGRKIYKDHHNAELGGSEYGTFIRERNRDAEHSGSAYVPLDSWVYPVIDRLAALGLVHSNFDSERPFTRLECARITAEAAENAASKEVSIDINSMVDSLQAEFSRESEVWAGNSDNRSAELESVYTRVTEISGPVLRDGYHFGQTLYNDYGRPYGRGFNEITGFSSRATSGPLVFYFRGEYQHAPGNPNYTPAQKSSIIPLDSGSPVVDNRFAAADRFQPLDAYIGVNFGNNQLSLGQQSLWWGPGTGGAFMLTNNAEPVKMVRLSRTTPLQLPGPMSWLGPMRYEVFVGQLDGYHFVFNHGQLFGPHLGTQPFIQGQRFSFKPTPNFEFGFTRTGLFGGTGYPLTTAYFLRATFSGNNPFPGEDTDPGDRRTGFDMTYRIPGFRDWLSFYLDEFAEDEFTPLLIPRRSAMHPGIYLAKIPKIPKTDLRVEGVYTDIPSFRGPGFFYHNFAFRDGFTNNADLLGSWIGREGRGLYATSTIWLSARNSLQLGYRGATADQEFIGGGHYQDGSLRASFALRSGVTFSGMLQYENWRFPVLAPGLQSNVTSSMQITYEPKRK
jgi:hypothetical protein